MKIVVPLQFFLVCLLLLGVAVYAALFFKTKESFVSTPTTQDNDIQLQACPSGTMNYDSKGDILCCRGVIQLLCRVVYDCFAKNYEPKQIVHALPVCAIILKTPQSERRGVVV
jgi:hypothetical protein